MNHNYKVGAYIRLSKEDNKINESPDDLVFEYGEVMPWFDKVGGGIQYRLPYSIEWLESHFYIKVTAK